MLYIVTKNQNPVFQEKLSIFCIKSNFCMSMCCQSGINTLSYKILGHAYSHYEWSILKTTSETNIDL